MWCDSASENSLIQRSFVTPASCKRVRTSIASTLSHSNNNLIWNEVLITSRTPLELYCLFDADRYRAGDLFYLQKSLTTSWFVMTALYKHVHRSIALVLSPSNNNLFWNEVQTTCRTFLSISCRYRAGSFSDLTHWIEIHWLLMCPRLLI